MTRTSGGSRSHEIEAEIDRTRAAMDRTVDAIAGKLTPQQLAFEALGVFKDGSSALATKIVQTAREHPVPATIIGIGIGLLLTEKSKGDSDTRFEGRHVGFGSTGRSYEGVSTRYETGAPEGVRGEGMAAGAMHKVEGAAGAVRDKAVDMKDSVAAGAMHAKDKAAETADHVKQQAAQVKGQVAEQAAHLKDVAAEKAGQVKETADHLRERVGETAGHVRDQAAQVPAYARQQWHDAKLGFWQTMDQRPFAIGVAALAAGVAAGLAVPASRRENELLGETRDRLLDQAKGLTKEAMDKGRQVARVAGEVVKSEVERQGLTAGGIAEKVRSIGREAEQAVKTEAERAVETLKATGPALRAGGDDTLPGGAAGRGMSSGFASTPGSPAAGGSTAGNTTGSGIGTSNAGTTGAGTTGTGNRTAGGSMGTTGTTTETKGSTTKKT